MPLFQSGEGLDEPMDSHYVNIEEMLSAARYDVIQESIEAFDPPADEVDVGSIQEQETPSSVFTPFALPSHLGSVTSIMSEDESIPLQDIHKPQTVMSRGELALGLWCTNTGTSRAEYSALLEVLKLLDQDVINRLPSRVDTLKRRVKEQLPLLELRKSTVPLAPEKQPSSRRDPVSGASVRQPKEDLIFFNPIDLFRIILSSNLCSKLHRGFAKFTDTPRELWQTDSWAGSVRTTCGE